VQVAVGDGHRNQHFAGSGMMIGEQLGSDSCLYLDLFHE